MKNRQVVTTRPSLRDFRMWIYDLLVMPSLRGWFHSTWFLEKEEAERFLLPLGVTLAMVSDCSPLWTDPLKQSIVFLSTTDRSIVSQFTT